MFTKEQIDKAKECKSAEELLAFARENEVALTEEEAAQFFADLNKTGELADDELDNVAGGCGGNGPACPNCGSEDTGPVTEWFQGAHAELKSRVIGYVCHKSRHKWD